MPIRTALDHAACGTLPGRGVVDKSHNRQASSARRLAIEAAYQL
jgi:hypothetical protein